MVEKSVLLKRLAALEEYTTDLEEFRPDKAIRRYVERTLHMATEGCIDIANHIISYEGFREPEDNKDSNFQCFLTIAGPRLCTAL
ncbi:MAG: DUF86 domain-containing protein [Clostridiaceae bacterium]|jgi:uncharacterized protein YutE (UPF0331/DUF86 family)|nr:DUF86 domain-containing protein [Clostridiaceae bacterium]